MLTKQEIIDNGADFIMKNQGLYYHIGDSQIAKNIICNTLIYLEQANVLMLVEEGDFKEGDMLDEGDVIFLLKPNMAGGINAYDYDGNPLCITPQSGCFVIRRANTPVYQCKKGKE